MHEAQISTHLRVQIFREGNKYHPEQYDLNSSRPIVGDYWSPPAFWPDQTDDLIGIYTLLSVLTYTIEGRSESYYQNYKLLPANISVCVRNRLKKKKKFNAQLRLHTIMVFSSLISQ